MSKVNIYNFEGKVVGTEDLNAKVFEVAMKPELIHFVANGLMANKRQTSAHTKTRGEVSGGGKKPWKQKGTGRARQGSIRSPLWRGGGVVFGPRSNRNFKIKINRKTKQTALNMVLSDKVRENALVILENFDLLEGKTKSFVKMVKTLPVVGKKVLIVFPDNKKDNLRRASQNLTFVKQENLEEVNLLDVLNSDTVLATMEAVKFWQKTRV
ncbi:MAG TPA: 50S ribosomal protein L4 [Candidatus Magasanikbacteria bacterium]|uniref:Large ribosomal subunit protein uL4 n=2 Tax=Candidatus Magasanikiibacteriota TaxID=1752731 RepID=A0A0G0WKI2_9BACT|nr:MAG: 50S ribosomal protein L4 [Candidatus Magasanikbacteria bacterium GW2011_GWC2_41_17]KKS13340.1 MAG: 50S ribosomal protein L4 [Candidatus Magasanikbacteria bacterium GW2011_GWA2_41_55]HBV58011.1 50S ribosomal protein L4 [Candidatus Magasanikbacteria bacterium]HBX16306.1 50S ribosomal protein L4 [Candidatus Magasanikbacteria bacterium]